MDLRELRLEVPLDHVEDHVPVLVGEAEGRAGRNLASLVAEVVRRRVDEVGARDRARLVMVGED